MTSGAINVRATVEGPGLKLLLAVGLVGLTLLGANTDAGANVAATPAVHQPAGVVPLAIEDDPLGTLVPAQPDAAAIYAAGDEGLYRSDDGGQTWEMVGPPPPPGQLVAAVDSPLLLLAGSHPPCARGLGEAVPLQRSEDGGATWTEVEGAVDILPLAIWSEANLALGASCAGLQLSTDAGRSWQAAPPMDAGYDASAFAVVETESAVPLGLIANTSEGGTTVVRTLDLSDPGGPVASEPLVTFWGGVSLAGRDSLFVAGTAAGVLVSTDGGATWASSRLGLEDVTISVDPNREAIPDAERRRGYGITAVAIAPDDPSHLYAGSVAGLYESRDTGATWQPVAGVEGWITVIVLASAGDRLLAQTDAGVFALAEGR